MQWGVLPPCLQALQYQMELGIAAGMRVDAHLMPLSARHSYGPELHANVCVIKMLE